MKQIIIILLLVLTNLVQAQDSIITNIVIKNVKTFTKNNNKLEGMHWVDFIKNIKKHNNIAIGEDHFFNEIPFFVNQITTEIRFDNFFCEIDPFSAKIIENRIKTLSTTNLDNYVKKYSNTFSFYALEPEFNLLKQLVNSGTNIYGTDQIILIADRLICSELKNISSNSEAIAIYKHIELKSKLYFNEFLKDQSKPFYLLTPEFESDLKSLNNLSLSKKEQEAIKALDISRKIYSTGSHHLRIQLMKNNLFKEYEQFKNSKNLFKYGGGHLAKGESFLEIYDIGNLINNISDSQFEKSVHILVIGKSGMQGVPFKGIPNQKIDTESDDLKPYRSFFNAMNKSEDWHLFDLNTISKGLKKENIQINDKALQRIIKGYDFLIIIPTVTAAKFIN